MISRSDESTNQKLARKDAPVAIAMISSIHFVLLGNRVQQGHEAAGMNVGNERARRHAQAVISVLMHYYRHTRAIQWSLSHMAHCGSSVCMNATSTGQSSCSNAGTVMIAAHVSGESSSSRPIPITASDVSKHTKRSAFCPPRSHLELLQSLCF